MEFIEQILPLVGYLVATYFISKEVYKQEIKSMEDDIKKFDRRIDDIELYTRRIEARLHEMKRDDDTDTR